MKKFYLSISFSMVVVLALTTISLNAQNIDREVVNFNFGWKFTAFVHRFTF